MNLFRSSGIIVLVILGLIVWSSTFMVDERKKALVLRFGEINRGISADEFCSALEHARAAGLWRFDTRWRRVIPHGSPVWLPHMQRLANSA